jgi:hypothetical protein
MRFTIAAIYQEAPRIGYRVTIVEADKMEEAEQKAHLKFIENNPLGTYSHLSALVIDDSGFENRITELEDKIARLIDFAAGMSERIENDDFDNLVEEWRALPEELQEEIERRQTELTLQREEDSESER